MTTTVNLFGLCAIGTFDDGMWAVMPSEMDHNATVLVEANKCDLHKSVADDVFIMQNPDGDQWLGWNVTNKQLHFADTDGAAGCGAAAKKKLLDLAEFHKGPHNSHGRATRFRLTKGELSRGPAEETYPLVQHNATLGQPRTIGTSVSWTGDGITLQRGSTELFTLSEDATIVISNVAPLLNGHEHFHLYYDCFLPQISKRDRISLGQPITPRHVHVYDCVPPVVLP